MHAAVMTDAELMSLAIEAARKGIEGGQSPFGACLARDGEPLLAGHNRVWANTDITAHAEVAVIRAVCATLGTIDLSGCTLYSTCEPCPMCFSAAHWARIRRVVFGARIADARAAGFNELDISCDRMRALGGSKTTVEGDVLREECRALFRLWTARRDRRPY